MCWTFSERLTYLKPLTVFTNQLDHGCLTWKSLSYRNQSIDLQRKSMDWFLFDRDLCAPLIRVHVIMIHQI